LVFLVVYFLVAFPPLSHKYSSPPHYCTYTHYCHYPQKYFQYLLLKGKNKTAWSESASELYRPSDRRLSAKWLPTFADRGCHVVSVTDPYGHILRFLDNNRYFSIK
jgi:hypothetical protein